MCASMRPSRGWRRRPRWRPAWPRSRRNLWRRERRFTRRRDEGKLLHMKLAFAEREVIARKGKPVSVIIPIKEYEDLMERLEDAEDLAYLKEVCSKPLSFRPLKEYLA